MDLAREKVTVWNGVPAQLHDLAGRPEANLSGLQEAWCGGAGTPQELRRAFEDVHHVPVRATYGLSEGSHHSRDRPGRLPGLGPGVSGRVLPHLDVAAYDAAAADGFPPGEQGELRLAPAVDRAVGGHAWTPALGAWRGAAVAPVSRALPDRRTSARSARTAWPDRDRPQEARHRQGRRQRLPGRGRAGDPPCHPAVAEVAVIGISDDRLGEKVAALVQFRGSPELTAVEALCRAELARYKVPEAWSVVDAFPLNPMGKIIRTGLAALLKD